MLHPMNVGSTFTKITVILRVLNIWNSSAKPAKRGGGEILPYMSYIGMCRCEGYGFQRVYSRIEYRNQRVLV